MSKYTGDYPRDIYPIRKPHREIDEATLIEITQAHRDELVRRLQFGALSFRALCVMIENEGWPPRNIDRGLVRRTLASCIDRGEVIGVLVRRPGLTRRHRERRAFYVYAPALHLLLERESTRRRREPRPVLLGRRWRR